jgi:CRISPR system Cascade subunit CasC
VNAPRFIDIHLLQTLPYSNINRDDLGSPKSLVYGGTDRTRVSSQSWKRAVRLEVENALADPAARTRRLPEQVSARLKKRGWLTDAADAAGAQVLLSATKEGLKIEKDGASSVLLYLPIVALDELADLADEHREAIEGQVGQKKPTGVLPAGRIGELLASRNGTINMFGRMLAELPGAEVDGTVQVAHAFTTHGTEPEIDFFTAVDDLNPPEARGSGHMNSAVFSAGVFYRYACVDIEGLLRNLRADTRMARELTREFLTAFISAMPTGKQNSTAAHTLPDLAYLAVRADRPISLAPAFESAVRAEADGWAAPSRRELARYATRLRQLWGTGGINWDGYACIDEKPLTGLGADSGSFHEVISQTVEAGYPADPA